MEETREAVDEERAFETLIRGYSLDQLEDVFAHLDRESYPDRFRLVQSEIRSRLDRLDEVTVPSSESSDAPSGLRRLWGSAVDLFVSLLPAGIIGLILAGAGVISVGGGANEGGGRGPRRGGGGRGRGRGRPPDEPAFLDQAVDFFTDPERLLGAVQDYGPYYGALVVYRILIVAPQWARTGSSVGLKEAGVRLVDAAGKAPSMLRNVIRIVVAYLVYPVTLGVGALWVFVDRNGRTLADYAAGIRVVRGPDA